MSLSPDAIKLVKTIKKAAVEAMESTKPVNLCFGIVESVSPLKINVEQKMDLGQAQLILSGNVTEHKITIEIDMDTMDASDGHVHHISGRQEVTVRNGLAVGEKVILARQQGGQKYFVLDRVVA